ncbi:MAG: hypothetical protein PVG90_05760 [Bacillota bacterium]|jgi:hypothetical protein
MGFYKYLLDTYGANEPILFGEISYKDYSRPWLFKELKKLTNDGKLIRFDTGVYYIPTKTVLGISVLNSRKVVEKKYVSAGGRVYGFYSGLTLQNRAGLTTQMPNTIEVVSNNESAKVREVLVGTQKVKARRARVKITRENVSALQFLDLMNSLDVNDLNEDGKQALRSFITARGITMRGILTYTSVYPARAMKSLVESGVIDEITRG